MSGVLEAVDLSPMVIGGETLEARFGETLDVLGPSTGAVMARVPAPGPEDVEVAVAHATEAFEGLSERGVIVADNVIWYGPPFNRAATDAETEGVGAFVEHVNADGRIRQVLLTVGDGLRVIWQQGSSA